MKNSTDIFCTLTPEQQKMRRSQIRANIVPLVHAVSKVGNTLQLEFAPSSGNRKLLEEFIGLEQKCCGFLNFTLSKPGQVLSLLIKGPPESAHIIDVFHEAVQEQASE